MTFTAIKGAMDARNAMENPRFGFGNGNNGASHSSETRIGLLTKLPKRAEYVRALSKKLQENLRRESWPHGSYTPNSKNTHNGNNMTII